MVRYLNNAACRFTMRHDWRWLFNLTGATEYTLDCYHAEPLFHVKHSTNNGIHFLRIGRFYCSFGMSSQKATDKVFEPQTRSLSKLWTMPKILDLNMRSNRKLHLYDHNNRQ